MNMNPEMSGSSRCLSSRARASVSPPRPHGGRQTFGVKTELLQGGDAELVVMVLGQRRPASPHDVGRDGLGGQLHQIHAADERLEPLVGERGLTPVELYDPVCEMRTVTSTLDSRASFLMAASRSFPNGSESYSYDRREIFHSLKSRGKTSVGWPRITNSRELSFRRLESKSSRLCSKNLHLLMPTLEEPANQGSRM